jgi:hypothetical protein
MALPRAATGVCIVVACAIAWCLATEPPGVMAQAPTEPPFPTPPPTEPFPTLPPDVPTPGPRTPTPTPSPTVRTATPTPSSTRRTPTSGTPTAVPSEATPTAGSRTPTTDGPGPAAVLLPFVVRHYYFQPVVPTVEPSAVRGRS